MKLFLALGVAIVVSWALLLALVRAVMFSDAAVIGLFLFALLVALWGAWRPSHRWAEFDDLGRDRL